MGTRSKAAGKMMSEYDSVDEEDGTEAMYEDELPEGPSFDATADDVEGVKGWSNVIGGKKKKE